MPTLKQALLDSTNVDGIVTAGVTPLLMENTVWDDIRVPATRIRQGASLKPDFNLTDLTLDFDDSSDETIYINIQMPHDWKIESDINPHIHWIQNQDQNIPWKFEYRWQLNNTTTTTAWTTIALDTLAFTYTSGSLNQISEPSSMITPTGVTISAIMQIKITRDVSEDSYSGDAQIYEFDVHYQRDTLGSKDEFVK